MFAGSVRKSGGAFLFAAVVWLCTLAACGSQPETEDGSDSSQQTASAADASRIREGVLPPVVLGVTDWTGAALTVAIAEVIIERRLGHPVEQVDISDTREMIEDLASNDLDAVLEVWPSSLSQLDQERIDRGEVAVLGELGVVAKSGWFVPRYVVDESPELQDWEAYRASAVAGLFATAQTSDRGRFLGTDPSWEQHDEELIEALSIPFEVEYSGSEQATVAEVQRAVRARQPILMYWWTPSSEITRFDLVAVKLPERTAECEAKVEAGQPQDCDYGEESLVKLGAVDLASTTPEIHAFLSKFSLDSAEQLELIDRVDNRGMSVTEVAKAWVDENQQRWEAWLG